MFLLLIFIKSCVAISIAPELRENELNASLGISFKYSGNLNNKLDPSMDSNKIKITKIQ